LSNICFSDSKQHLKQKQAAVTNPLQAANIFSHLTVDLNKAFIKTLLITGLSRASVIKMTYRYSIKLCISL